jgi:hypothetical protein
LFHDFPFSCHAATDPRILCTPWLEIEAIQQYVEHEEARESFKQEALASWAAYKETEEALAGSRVGRVPGRFATVVLPGRGRPVWRAPSGR